MVTRMSRRLVVATVIVVMCGACTGGDQATPTTTTTPAVTSTTGAPPSTISTTTTSRPPQPVPAREVTVQRFTVNPIKVEFYPDSDDLTVRMTNLDDQAYTLVFDWNDEEVILEADGSVVVDFAEAPRGTNRVMLSVGAARSLFTVDTGDVTDDPVAAREDACDAAGTVFDVSNSFIARLNEGVTIVLLRADDPVTIRGQEAIDLHADFMEEYADSFRVLEARLADAREVLSPWSRRMSMFRPLGVVDTAIWSVLGAEDLEALLIAVTKFETGIVEELPRGLLSLQEFMADVCPAGQDA